MKRHLLCGLDVFGAKPSLVDAITAEARRRLSASGAWEDPTVAGIGDELRRHFGLVFADVSVITYVAGANAGEAYATVDVVERGEAWRLPALPEPTDAVEDSSGLIAAWRAYVESATSLLSSGRLALEAPPKCAGGFHCLFGFAHPDLAPFEPRFVGQVPPHIETLTRMLRRDREPERRAAAAYLLAYARTRDEVVSRLLPSIEDPASLVRNNVLRVLAEVQDGASAPLLPLGHLLRALELPTASDRNKAAYALLSLLGRGTAGDRETVRRQAGRTLAAMAGLLQPNNREPAAAILKLLSDRSP